ncbi:caspase family protein [Methylocystis sp. H62]|uniref:caspase family protein n=1 Tax=Methylocystis sp. H62 TaxID=2785789 RepID=UPI0018C2140D|nr:caspase family protein [Methylocystis sp. H62]MBG0792330.1 caspase family protein [Methylocystis sp. H62]
MPNLAVNNLDNLAGIAGVHAFIVGISDYNHLPGDNDPARPATFNLRKLTSPATSAYKFYEWVRASDGRLRRPLATCHLLLAPSPSELAATPDMANFVGATTNDFVREARQWRRLCGDNVDSQAIFYFCGHGVQVHDQDAVLLLQDFGDPNSALENSCVRFSNIFEGMAPHLLQGGGEDFRDMAREQIYFVDACREKPEQLAGLRSFQGISAFSSVLPDEDTRDAPVFFSTIPGEQAFGATGQISIFTSALLEALGKACDASIEDENGDPQWPVNARFLHKVLKYLLARRTNGPPQRIANLQGLVGDPTLHYLPDAPQIETEVSIVPDHGSDATAIEIRTALNDLVVWSTNNQPRPAHPFKLSMRLDAYRIEAKHPGLGTFRSIWLPAADEHRSRMSVRLRPSPGV